jgi:hypothetical protein
VVEIKVRKRDKAEVIWQLEGPRLEGIVSRKTVRRRIKPSQKENCGACLSVQDTYVANLTRW